MNDSEHSQHVVVTGGSSGIGEAVVRLLRSRGVKVTVFDLEESPDASVRTCIVNVADEQAVGAALDGAVSRHGPVTGLVCSAGVRGAFKPALELDLDQVRRVLEVNILGTLVPSREVVRRLAGIPGSIVALSSTTAYGGWPKQADYGTSKAAVTNLVQHLAVEWAPLGVRVNAVAPGHTLTPMVQEMVVNGYDLAPVTDRTPLGRLASPEEMAVEIVHLLRDASHVTGQCLAVDGGWTSVGK